MTLQSLLTLAAFVPWTLGYPDLKHFPEYRSLAGLSQQQVQEVLQTLSSTPGPQPLPPPVKDTSAKLVYDDAHPYIPPGPGDIRGPCPGLNTLASHGYLNRNGVVTPGDIITASQEGFNMGWHLASFVTYVAFIVNGNHLTNWMSIGANVTGENMLTPGLNIHGTFEGDASITRGDIYFGDHFNFNETLFDQLADSADTYGNGMITFESAVMNRAMRIHDSMTRNPTFTFNTPRYQTAYVETAFPVAFFVSNQTADTTTGATIQDTRRFFQDGKYPEGFYRRQASFDVAEAKTMFDKVSSVVGVKPGQNDGAGNYVLDPEDTGTFCYMYQKQTNVTARLYPDPGPELAAAIKANLNTFYQALGDPTCEQLFPFGK